MQRTYSTITLPRHDETETEVGTEADAGQRAVSAAHFAAASASLRAEAAWERFVATVERDGRAEQAHRELTAAVAEQVYAWAVYHGALADLEG